MADLEAVRQAMADALNTLPEMRAWPQVPDQLQSPAAVIEPDEVDWSTAMQRGHDKWTMLVRILVGIANSRAAQIERDKHFGGVKDVKDALESHVPLKDGTVAHDVFVSRARKFDTWTFGESVYLGVEIVVDVYAA